MGVYQPQIEVQPSQEQQNGERTIKSELELLSEEKRKILDTAKSQAEEFAAGILEGAYSKRDRLVNAAYEEAERIKKNAQKERYRKGIEQPCGEITVELATLRQSVGEMGQQLAAYEQETEDKIIKLTLDVAEKTLTRRVKDDNTIIAGIMEKAVLSEHDKNDIIAHITDKSSKLVDNLEQGLEPLRERVSDAVKMRPEDEPPSYARIETEEGIIDVSVCTQLESLREQLALLVGKE